MLNDVARAPYTEALNKNNIINIKGNDYNTGLLCNNWQ